MNTRITNEQELLKINMILGHLHNSSELSKSVLNIDSASISKILTIKMCTTVRETQMINAIIFITHPNPPKTIEQNLNNLNLLSNETPLAINKINNLIEATMPWAQPESANHDDVTPQIVCESLDDTLKQLISLTTFMSTKQLATDNEQLISTLSQLKLSDINGDLNQLKTVIEKTMADQPATFKLLPTAIETAVCTYKVHSHLAPAIKLITSNAQKIANQTQVYFRSQSQQPDNIKANNTSCINGSDQQTTTSDVETIAKMGAIGSNTQCDTSENNNTVFNFSGG